MCRDLLLSLKILGFLDSRVCRSTGMSPSGSSLPKLSFSSLGSKQTPSVDRKQTQLIIALYRYNFEAVTLAACQITPMAKTLPNESLLAHVA